MDVVRQHKARFPDVAVFIQKQNRGVRIAVDLVQALQELCNGSLALSRLADLALSTADSSSSAYGGSKHMHLGSMALDELFNTDGIRELLVPGYLELDLIHEDNGKLKQKQQIQAVSLGKTDERPRIGNQKHDFQRADLSVSETIRAAMLVASSALTRGNGSLRSARRSSNSP